MSGWRAPSPYGTPAGNELFSIDVRRTVERQARSHLASWVRAASQISTSVPGQLLRVREEQRISRPVPGVWSMSRYARSKS